MRVRSTVQIIDPDTGSIKFKTVYEDKQPIINPDIDNHAVDTAAEVKKEQEEKNLHIQPTPPSPPASSPDTVDRRGGVKGTLICNGKPTDSEVVYWRDVPVDRGYESPLTPHHHEHASKYITFEYDNGGWNNIRMGVETVIVLAHAMGRTLVIPPPQHLYLLDKRHRDKVSLGLSISTWGLA